MTSPSLQNVPRDLCFTAVHNDIALKAMSHNTTHLSYFHAFRNTCGPHNHVHTFLFGPDFSTETVSPYVDSHIVLGREDHVITMRS